MFIPIWVFVVIAVAIYLWIGIGVVCATIEKNGMNLSERKIDILDITIAPIMYIICVVFWPAVLTLGV